MNLFSSQTCYYYGEKELVTASEAQVACSAKHGGRAAVLTNKYELNEVKIHIEDASTFNAWIGMGLMTATSENMLLADGREFSAGEFLDLESDKSPDKTACADCLCVFIDGNGELRYGKCTEKRPILCEYKGTYFFPLKKKKNFDNK